MTLNRSANDESSLRLTNSGGLNTTSSSQTLPYKDAAALVNFDVDSSGKLVKRGGTLNLYTQATEYKIYSVRFNVTPRVGFLLTKVGNLLVVSLVYNDSLLQLYSVNMFKSPNKALRAVELFDGETPSVLLLSEGTTPIQMFGYFESSLSHSGPTYYYQDSKWSSLINSSRYAFADGALCSSAWTSTFVNNLPNQIKDLDIIALRWYWWAEAETWNGQDFYQVVARAGDAPSDQHVVIPAELRTDLEQGSTDLPWTLFFGNSSTKLYTENTSGTPVRAYEYSFSDGTNYDSTTSQTPLTKSSLFATFGRNNFPNKQRILDKNVNSVTDRFELDDHGYRTHDEVSFSLGDDGVIFPGLSVGTTYYVNRIDNGSFELYHDIGLVSKVNLSDRNIKYFTDSLIRHADSAILIAGHGFSNRDQVVLGSDTKLPTGLLNTVSYYVRVIDGNWFSLCFDSLLRHNVFISAAPKVFFTTHSSSPNTVLQVGATSLLDGDRIRFSSNTGTLPAGLTEGALYYCKVIDVGSIQIFTDPSLTSVVTMQGGSGVCFLIQDFGTHTIRLSTGSVFLERKPYDSCGISRHRKLRFNNGNGITSTNLDVRVDGVTYNFGSYTAFSAYRTVTTNPNALIKWVAFQTGTLGLPRVARVTLVNKSTQFVGGDASNTPRSLSVSGGYIPVYGFGRFADYSKGVFPTTGVLLQGRLVLAGFQNKPGLLLFSGVSDAAYTTEFFNFYQVTDALTSPTVDPFDLNIVSGNQSILTALMNYQSSLFVFSYDTTYRLRGSESGFAAGSVSLYTVAHQGAVNPDCVARSENSVLIVSPTGVYDINLALEDNFASSEVSTKVSKFFASLKDSKYHELPWIVYDNFRLKFYFGLPSTSTAYNDKLLVLDSRTGSWTRYESYAQFRTYSGFTYRDNLLGSQVGITAQLPCFVTVTRLNYSTPLDYVTRHLSPNGQGLEPIYEYKETYNGVLVYEFDLFELPFKNYTSFRVVLSESLQKGDIEALPDVAYQRLPGEKLVIELFSNPGNGKYLVLIKEARMLFQEGVKHPYDEAFFQSSQDLSNICFISSGT